MMAQALPYFWYPVLVTGAVAAFAAMLAAGLAAAWAAYVPITLVAVAVVALEQAFPERLDWRPQPSDVKADAAFMVLIQLVLPRALAALSVLAIAEWMHEQNPIGWWPHSWPLAAQTLMMVLAVDFVRYWLHRACHCVDFLWRLHEVHHSPDILYSLNVGRFHPFEKTLHFCLDTVPFLLLGVSPEVIAVYFLLYSVNGFFQHSNVRLRYGWLNYLVGSAETHRWHHARDPKTAACNFGNTTIVWDLAFGTWHLPSRGPVGDIGIMDRAYPKGFLAQMFTPFRRADRPRRTLKRWLADALVMLHLRRIQLAQQRRIAAGARDPMHHQNALLAQIVRSNRDTTFGRQHGFRHITGYDEFVRRVPVGDYESLRPYVEAEIERGEKALTDESPERYVRTSGTTGKPKDIPITRLHLAALREIHQASVAFQHRTCPQAFAGGIVALVSPMHEGVLSNGKPFGSASGIVASDTPALVREKFVIPAAVLTISDSRVKYLLILRLALARRDVTYFGAANPTTLLALIKLYRAHQTVLVEDLRRGTFFLADKLSSEVQSAIAARLAAQPQRAAELARLHADHAGPRIADLWPALRLVVTWTCASAGLAVDALRRELCERTRILELGYLSSEFRGTFTLGRRAGSGLPTFDTHFFEFVERDRWDRGEQAFLTLDRVRKGVDYYIIVTTPAGLYRYFINDLVRVTGFLHQTPLLKFVQKGKGVTNITGEKLYEAQVLAAVRAALAKIGRSARLAMMLADEQAYRYHLYVEPDPGPKPDAARLAQAVDTKLAELNLEYMAKRESGRLGPLSAHWLASDAGEQYKQHCVKRGQREGQFKTVALAYRKEVDFDLDALVEGASQ